MDMEKGVTPIVTAMLLTGMVLGMGILTYQFLQQQQDLVVTESQQAMLSTINTSCEEAFVSWWIQNNAQYGIDTVDISIRERGSGTDTLTLRDVTVPEPVRQGQATSELAFSLPETLDRGTLYDITLEADHDTLETSCRVGESWWDTSWNYRRQVDLAPANIGPDGTTAVQLNASRLVSEQKLQPRCQDIRTVIGQQTVPHNVSAPGKCSSTERLNVTFPVSDYNTADGRTYIYYGNLQTGIDPPWTQHADITYIADVSDTMFDEWDSLKTTVNSINDGIAAHEPIDLHTTLHGLNNTYNGEASDQRVCQFGQSLSSPLNCNRTTSAIDDITQMTAYADWIDMNISNYHPLGQPTPEAPSKGWGMATMDIIERYQWRDNADRFLVVIGDHDTTGGVCGDNRSEALAGNLSSDLPANDITMYALMGNPTCNDNPNDGIHTTYTARQMNMTGTVIQYNNANDLTDHILDHFNTALTSWQYTNDLGPEERINTPR